MCHLFCKYIIYIRKNTCCLLKFLFTIGPNRLFVTRGRLVHYIELRNCISTKPKRLWPLETKYNNIPSISIFPIDGVAAVVVGAAFRPTMLAEESFRRRSRTTHITNSEPNTSRPQIPNSEPYKKLLSSSDIVFVYAVFFLGSLQHGIKTANDFRGHSSAISSSVSLLYQFRVDVVIS